MTAVQHARRLLALLLLTGATVVALAAAASAHAPSEESFVSKINAERTERGLAPLAVDVQLTRIARDWTAQMASASHLSHRPDLSTVVQGDWRRIGENVGRSFDPGGASEAEFVRRLHDAFMASDGHRRNILRADWTHIGVGVELAQGGLEMWVTVNFLEAPWSVPESQVAEGARIAQAVFADHGADGRQAAFAVIARADVFADALAGSALAGNQAPILFTPGPNGRDGDPALHPRTRAEVDRVLGGSGVVYLLGGHAAVSPRAEAELTGAGYTIRRLAGPSRVETSVRIADEALRLHGAASEVLIARADEWPDAVAAGAYAAAHGAPLVLTEHGSLHPETARFLARHGFRDRWALGGSAALADGTVRAAGATRIAGRERTETAVRVAERLWGRRSGSAGDRFASAPSHGDVAWAHALALAPWSAAHAAPQLLVSGEVPASVQDYLAGLAYANDQSGDVFASSAVPGAVVRELQSLLGR